MCLPWLASAAAFDRPARVPDRTARRRPARPTSSWPPARPATRAASRVILAERHATGCRRLPLRSSAHFSASDSSSSSPVAPGEASPNGSSFSSSSTGVWSEQIASMVPSSRPGADRVAVALAAQRRRQARVGVEEADVGVGQVHVVRADVAGDRQPFLAWPRAPAPGRRPTTCGTGARGRRWRAPVRRSCAARWSRPSPARRTGPGATPAGPLWAMPPRPMCASCGRSQTV